MLIKLAKKQAKNLPASFRFIGSLVLILSLGLSFSCQKPSASGESDAIHEDDAVNNKEVVYDYKDQRAALANKSTSGANYLNGFPFMEHLQHLASDEMAGRLVGTPGSKMARDTITGFLKANGIQAFGESYHHEFRFERKEKEIIGNNIVGIIPGTGQGYIVLSAHYDHLGESDGKIYNGADDNASGTVALLAAANYFKDHQMEHSLILAFFDAEEGGLQGAKAFVAANENIHDEILMNINLDMVSRNDEEIFITGSYHYPKLKEALSDINNMTDLKVLFGHDHPDEGHNDWTMSSDHGPFHKAEIPFCYLGVEDHPDYHQDTDTYEKINVDFYRSSINLIIEIIKQIDKSNVDFRSK